MANMSASILREIVAKVFEIQATKVKLSGEISPTWKGSSTTGVSYTDISDSGDFNIHGFNPVLGFQKIDGVIENTHFSRGNHEKEHSDACNLSEIEGIEDYIFFLVISGDNSDLPHSLEYTLYKAPNFREHWTKLTKEDIARWEQWLQS
jgi:hypothetical protein